MPKFSNACAIVAVTLNRRHPWCDHVPYRRSWTLPPGGNSLRGIRICAESTIVVTTHLGVQCNDIVQLILFFDMSLGSVGSIDRSLGRKSGDKTGFTERFGAGAGQHVVALVPISRVPTPSWRWPRTAEFLRPYHPSFGKRVDNRQHQFVPFSPAGDLVE